MNKVYAVLYPIIWVYMKLLHPWKAVGVERVPEGDRAALLGVLAQDPRPAYVRDPDRVYGVAFGGFDVRFTVDKRVLTVRDVVPIGL